MKPATYVQECAPDGRCLCAGCGDDLSSYCGAIVWCPRCRHERQLVLGPIQLAAKQAIARAVVRGEMPPARQLRCFDCGVQALDYDHRDYTKPMNVQALCRSCNLLRGPADNWGELPRFVTHPCGFSAAIHREAVFRPPAATPGQYAPRVHRIPRHKKLAQLRAVAEPA